ncbi:RNA 2'-phosphotransferase [Novosphingobium sp. AAP1]|uniref:RNA 2'-phosphotransferase n=1 Tax=Novosphingobium sp. AAP1 TaxID=1523413 RepID=UPI0006B9AB5B|nr:RNA 2'-phosphotransferase [Novosphingobium sp. AAP1]KPF52062.1 RNA 2'-phosphotransferase [Novosphingobium sp. AAP1]
MTSNAVGDLSSLSRAVSHALRHEPWLYELELDEAGWVPIEDLLGALRTEKPAWAGMGEADLVYMIEQSEKKRHELRDGKIRALYGHSVPQRLSKEAAPPPAVLYHGTAPATVALIKEAGLRPMGRQYVHLSADTATAKQVGKRKAGKPVILSVRAGEAHRAGVPFYLGNDQVWLADMIGPEFIDEELDSVKAR